MQLAQFSALKADFAISFTYERVKYAVRRRSTAADFMSMALAFVA
jgi:hypothetical protein